MEADFQRFYQLDLLDYYRGKITPRKLCVLVMNLPAGANTWQVMGVDAAWTTGEHLMASAVDALNGANWQRGGGKGQQPKPMPRPNDIKTANETKNKAFEKAMAFKSKQEKKALRATQ